MDNTLTPYSQKDLENICGYILSDLTLGLTPAETPTAYLLGGQSGAGKSIISRRLAKQYQGNIILINADEFRKFHPHFRQLNQLYGKDAVLHTQEFSGRMTELIIDRLSDQKYNLMIEGTLRTTDVPLKTQEKLSKKGYRVELLVMAVKPLLSYVCTVLRYEKMLSKGAAARATPKSHHDYIAANIAKNLTTLYKTGRFQNIMIYDRRRNCLYDQKNTPKKDPGQALHRVLTGAWSYNEKKEIETVTSQVVALLKQRNAPELPQFLKLCKKINRITRNKKTKPKQ